MYDTLQCQLLTTELVVALDLTTCKQKYDPHLVSSAKQAERWPLPQDNPGEPVAERYKKLSYRRGIAVCVVSVEILPTATQQCRNYLYDKS